MKKADFESLKTGLREAVAIERGRMKAARELRFTPRELKALRARRGKGFPAAFLSAKVRSIRDRLGLSQAEFAGLLRVSKSTLQNWEQGRRAPEGPALSLLLVADRAPKAVLEALHGKNRSA